jgi:Metallo-beta-lactamase superfamily
MTAHPDHAGFAERARTDAGAQVWIHQADAETARTGKPEERRQHVLLYLLRNAFYRTAFSLARRGAVKIIPVKEVSSFADGEVIDVPGSPRALHTPGHTPGSAAIAVEKRNALLAGDAMCTWNPYTGRVGPQIMPSALNMSSAQAMATRIGVQPGQLVTRQRHGTSSSPRPRGHLAGLREHHGVAEAGSSTGVGRGAGVQSPGLPTDDLHEPD